ncbi:MAG: helicase associated domain-containing protein [Salinivirgaceae bacterium]
MENYQKEWLKIFMVLLEYKAKYGHVDVPARDKFKGVGLGNWVVRQRVIKDKLPKEHRNLLKKAGFNWTPRVGDWDGKFKLLLKFYEKNKHTRVPIDFKKYPELAPWVHKQRRLRVDGKLEDDKISKLNHVHFVWDVSDHLWEIKLNQLVEFHAEHGHFYTPTNKKYVSLSGWRSEQIRVYKSGKLSKDRFERLMEIGFDLTNKSITEVVIAQAENGKFYRVIPQ